MSLFTPDAGLLFWMLLSFGIVLALLAKFGFPVIVRAVEQRRDHIDASLRAAEQANARVEQVKSEIEALLGDAHARQAATLKEALDAKARIMADAKKQAQVQLDGITEEARRQIAKQKDAALQQIRAQVAVLSVEVAERIMRERLSGEKSQMEMIDRILDEIETQRKS